MLKTTKNAESAYKLYDLQLSLVSKAIENDSDIHESLSAHGLDLEKLGYENSRTVPLGKGKPPKLSDFNGSVGIKMVSFFAGCGGMDLGFEAAGFESVACFEFNEIFCRTLRKNRPDWNVFGPPFHSGDVSKFDDIVSALSPLIQIPFEGVFVGGPPCQPFSIAANQRFSKEGENFKRTGFSHAKNGNLLFDYIKLICHFKPAAFVIENVPGLYAIDGGEQLSLAISELALAGYNVSPPQVLDAADYGVPQHRQRMFVIGSRKAGSFELPAKGQHYGCGSVLFDKAIATYENHETRKHKAESLERYMALDYGQRDQLGRVDRLNPAKPSKTVIAGGTNGGGRSHLHPEIPRTLSVRECARLQTFPDEYIFTGPTARQFTQVGNAVPPVLAAQIALQVAKAYFPIDG